MTPRPHPPSPLFSAISGQPASMGSPILRPSRPCASSSNHCRRLKAENRLPCPGGLGIIVSAIRAMLPPLDQQKYEAWRRPPRRCLVTDAVTPANIFNLGVGFWASKTLLSAVEIGLFTELAKGPADLTTLSRRLGLHDRSARDFLDALVALKMLERKDR